MPLPEHEAFQDFQDPENLDQFTLKTNQPAIPDIGDDPKCSRCGTPLSQQPGFIIVAMMPMPCPACAMWPG